MRSDMEFWKEVRRRVLTNELSKRAVPVKSTAWAGGPCRRSSPTMSRPAIAKSRSRESEAQDRGVLADHSPDSGGRPAGPQEAAPHRRGGFSSGCGTSTSSTGQVTRSSRTPCGPGSSRTRRCFCRCHTRRERPKSILAKRLIRLSGQPTKVALFVMTLPYSAQSRPSVSSGVRPHVPGGAPSGLR